MKKSRLENFSDGVFAFAITLLVLNIKLPVTGIGKYRNMHRFFLDALPHLLTFAFTFLVIGVFWVAHHRIFCFVKVIDSFILWQNIVYLLFIALIPLTASVLSENPFNTAAILLYSFTLMIIASGHVILLMYIFKRKNAKHDFMNEDVYSASLKIASAGPVSYLMAAITCFTNAYLSFFFILGPLVYYIFFSGLTSIETTLIEAAKTGKAN